MELRRKTVWAYWLLVGITVGALSAYGTKRHLADRPGREIGRLDSADQARLPGQIQRAPALIE